MSRFVRHDSGPGRPGWYLRAGGRMFHFGWRKSDGKDPLPWRSRAGLAVQNEPEEPTDG